jgi:NADPH:quinone reductase-like Zn-dependent oxidoreductase
MFTRSLFQTADMEEQGKLLSKVAGLVDQGMIRTTMTERLSPINAENLKQAHAQIEKGTMIGKLVLEEFEHSSRPALPRGERP